MGVGVSQSGEELLEYGLGHSQKKELIDGLLNVSIDGASVTLSRGNPTPTIGRMDSYELDSLGVDIVVE